MALVRTAGCIVVGGGPGGLGTAALLEQNGIDTILLEREEHVAARWRAGYDRLRLNTSSWFSYLPGRRFPRRHGRWLHRDDLVAYYDDYAHRHSLRIDASVEATRITRRGNRWAVETTRGTYEAPAVVVATGKQHTGVVPDWPGRAEFAGTVLHTSAYRNATPFRGRRALVVGGGNSAMDAALDLLDGGAADVRLSLRRPPHLMPREALGLPHDLLGVAARRAPRPLLDANAKLIRRATIGDLSDVGLPVPADGTVSRFERDGRVPTLDTGAFSRALRSGRVQVVAAIDRFEKDAVLLTDGERVEAEVVVAATGYRTGLEALVGHLGVLDADELPVVHAEQVHPAAPQLYFVGYVDPRSGQLRELRLEARRVARALRPLGCALTEPRGHEATGCG